MSRCAFAVVCVWTAIMLSGRTPLGAAQTVEAAPRLVWRIDEDARAIPARDSDSVYFLTHRHEMVAADVDTGRVRWRVPMDSTGDTFGSRVVVHGDIVVAGDYNLVGLHRRTGQRIWQFVPEDNGGAGLYLGGAEGGLAFAGSLTGRLRAVDMQTGRERWSVAVGARDTTMYAPVVRDGVVAATFTTFGAESVGGVIVVDVRTGRLRWRRSVPGSIGASGNPVFAGRAVLASARDGTIHAFDAGTGESLWTWPGVGRIAGEQDYRPLAVSGRMLIAGSVSGEVVAYDWPTRRVMWKQAPTMASVAFDIVAHDNVVFVPYFSNQIIAYRARDGAELWRIGGGTSQFRWVPHVQGPWLLASGSRTFSMFRRNGFESGRRR